MSEYVFRDAPGFGCDMSELMDGGCETVGDYYASNANDHFGTLHEEIVRCEGCKFFREDELGVFCTWFDFEDLDEERQRVGFCAWGERRGDTE